jgi:ribosomal protein L37AE/L43A
MSKQNKPEKSTFIWICPVCGEQFKNPRVTSHVHWMIDDDGQTRAFTVQFSILSSLKTIRERFGGK